jgi:AraC-like DNA-binding protein
MFDQNYFVLRLLRLKSAEEWSPQKEGLYFLFPKDGVGQFLQGSAAQRLAAGDILVADGSPAGKLSAAKGAELLFWSFSLRVEHLLPLFAGDEVALLEDVTGHFKESKLFPASSPLAKKCHRWIEEVPTQSDLEHRSHLLRIGAAILNDEFRTAQRQRVGMGQVEDRIIQVFEQLSVDQLLGHSVPELAGKFGCSRRHLNRLFHQYFGFSVGALRMEMRLLKAVSLLRDANSKVINVAAQCGFNHLGLFNTCFKRRFGIAPGQWRKEVSRGSTQPAPSPVEELSCPLRAKGLCPISAGSPGGTTPLAPKTAPGGKSAGAKPSRGSQPVQRTLEPRPPLIYPKANTPTQPPA